jgi:hypothetical protein
MFETFTEESKTQILCSIFVFEYRAVYVIMHKNIVEPDGPEVTISRTHIACCINKATGTHSEFIIQVPGAFQLQQWLQKRA